MFRCNSVLARVAGSPRRPPAALPIGAALMIGAALAAPAARADIPEMLACADQADPKARLDCYDAAAAKLKTEMAEAEKRKASLFGFTLPFGDSDSAEPDHAEPKLAPTEINMVSGHVVGAVKDIAGHLTLSLDNGQSWRIEDARPVPLRVTAQTQVVIMKNGFGGYYMSVDGRDSKLSVTRLK